MFEKFNSSRDDGGRGSFVDTEVDEQVLQHVRAFSDSSAAASATTTAAMNYDNYRF